ncbi:glycosyltransferase, partial [Siccirubricoccus sp. KC 17139]
MTVAISVVVPCYNRAGLVPETLGSILGQTLPPAEVIVVDDGSTDGTAAVLAGFGDRIRTITIPNSGELVARNTGLRLAGGELVAFCDSDDLWRPDHLERMARLWRQWPSMQAAYANFRIVRDGVWEEGSKFAQAPAGFWDGLRHGEAETGCFEMPIVDRLVGFTPFFPSALVASIPFLRSIGGWDEAVNRWMSMDFSTALLLAERPPLGVSFEPSVGIRKHAGNFSADVQKMNLGDAAILEHVLRTRPSLAPHATLIRASIEERRLAALATAFARQDFQGVRAIRALLGPAGLPPRARAKAAVAA